MQLIKNDALSFSLQGGHWIRSSVRPWISHSCTESLSPSKLPFIIISLFCANDAIIQLNLPSLRKNRNELCVTWNEFPAGSVGRGKQGWRLRVWPVGAVPRRLAMFPMARREMFSSVVCSPRAFGATYTAGNNKSRWFLAHARSSGGRKEL